MTTLTKSLAAALVVVALGAAWWTLRDRAGGAGPDANGATSAAATSDAATPHVARAKRSAPEPSGSPVPSNLSAFADFDADRDVRGVVVDRADHPVEGATVSAYAFDIFRWSLDEMRGATTPAGAPRAESRSAADGSFRLRLTPGEQTVVRVTAKGFADAELPYLQTGQTVRVVLGLPTTLRVRVLDAAGSPCAGASVLAQPAWTKDDPSRWTRAGTTGADGVVSWDGLPRAPATRVELDVSPGPGRAPTNAPCTIEDREMNETVVTLPAGRTIEGRVIDAETSVGVAAAKVFADPQRPAVASAQADGRFRVENWTAQPRWAGDPENRLGASADGYTAAWGDVPEANDSKPFVIGLRRGFEVTGVVAGPDGRPIAGAQVIAIARERSGHGRSVLDATTDAAGGFRISGLPRDVLTPLAVTAPGFAQTVVSLTPPPKAETTLALGTITVAPGRTVRGRVVDESGAGMPQMHVRLGDPNDPNGEVEQFRTSLDDGRFAFAGVAPGKHSVRASGRGPDQNEARSEIVVPTDADPASLTIVYGVAPPKPPAKVTLATRVVDENGVAVPNVPFGVGYAAGGFSGVVKAGADGSLDVACEQEPQMVSTYLDGELAKRYLYQHVWLRPGATVSTMVLKRGEPISGTVVDSSGKPLKGTWVEADIASRQVGYAITDAEGRFTCAVPPGSTVDLEARPSPTGKSHPQDLGAVRGVSAGATDVTIRIEPVEMGRTLEVVLVMPDGVSAGKCDVWANYHGMDQSNQIAFRKTFDASGRLQFEGLPLARVSLRAMVRVAGDDDKTYTGLTPISVDGDATSARIVVPAFRIVRGRVVDETGAPSPRASLFSTAAFNASAALADEQGVFALRVPSDAEAPFLVTATKMPYDRKAPFGGWDIVEAGPDRELEIVLRPRPPR